MRKKMAVLFTALLLITGGCGLRGPAPKPEQARVAPDVVVEEVRVGGVAENELGGLLQRMAETRYRSPRNASFDGESGAIIPDRPGRYMNVAATRARIMAAPAGSRLSAVYQDIVPELTGSRLERARKVGAFTSPILHDEAGRLQNIRLTAQLINNSVIEPGDEFSFNHITGEPDAGRGFQKAVVFGRDGGTEYELGGGMCQVSSTLYNAVLNAGLPVTERHPHSRPVDYVPAGCDATTYTDKDFRFINNTRHTLIIRSLVTGRKLTVDLWSLPAHA